MRKSIILLLSVAFIISCNNSASNESPSEDSIAEADLLPEERLAWITEYDSLKNEFVLKQQRIVNAETLTAQGVIADINATWDSIKIVYRRVSNDTLYVAIPESDFLTQQMGSSGSSEYMASATYNLTELKGIRFVNYDFKEGDHLSPGTFSRDNFKEFR